MGHELAEQNVDQSAGGLPSPHRRRRLIVRFVLAIVVSIPTLALLAVGGSVWWSNWQLKIAADELNDDRIRQAAARINRCLRIWPDDPIAHVLAAQAARRQSRYIEALRHLNEAEKRLTGQDDRIIFERLLLRAQTGEVEQCSTALQNFAHADPAKKHQVLEAMAAGYLQLQRAHEAMMLLNILTEMHPNSARAWMMKGWTQELMGINEDSIAAYQRVVEIDPDDPLARSLLGSVLLEGKRPSEALVHFEFCSRHLPSNPTHLARQAECLALLGRYDESRQLINRVLKLAPKHSGALRIAGRLAMEAGDLAEAERCLRESLVEEPWDFGAHFQLMSCLDRLGREADAREVEKRFHIIQQDTDRLHSILRKRVGDSPNEAAVYLEAGVALIRCGQASRGLEWIQRCLQLEPRNPVANAVLAKHHERTNDLKAADMCRVHVKPDTVVPPLDLPPLPPAR